jgi:hypothetical protein
MLADCQAIILQNVVRSWCKKHYYNSTNSVTTCGPLAPGLTQSVVTRPRAGRSMGGIPARGITFSLPKLPNWFRHPPSDIFIRYQGVFPRVNKPRHVVNLSSPSRANVKNERTYTSNSPLCLHGVDKDNVTFLPPFKSLSQYLSLVIF